jgi:hypothetical protein
MRKWHQRNIARRLTGRWLSGTALYSVIGAWAMTGVYGWLSTADGLMRIIAVVLTVGCAVFASRAFKNATDAATIGQRVALMGLGGACLLWTGFAGHRGLEASDDAAWAPYERQADMRRQVAEIDAAIAALPPVPLSDEQGRPLGPVRTKVLVDARETAAARLAAQKPAVGALLPRPADRMPEALSWAIVGLIEALELFGVFALAGRRESELNAGRVLAQRRWAMA